MINYDLSGEVEKCRSHSELVSESNEMLKQVQHDLMSG